MAVADESLRAKRYDRNGTSISPAENEILANKSVCVLGCGGLGGYISEMLLRVGILQITLIDSDIFDETNLNRQLFCTEVGIGKPKVFEAEKRLLAVDSNARIKPLKIRLDSANAEKLLAGHDVVLDALDNIGSRRIAAKACDALGIPFIHGAISGWYAQVSVLLPGGAGLEPIYGKASGEGSGRILGNMPYVAGLTACIQCIETVKLLLGKSPNLQGSIARIDLMDYAFDVFSI